MPAGSTDGQVLGGRLAARAARTKPHAGMYTQASTSKVAIMEWITMQVLSESWVMCALHQSGEICPEANLA
jgi:hypothetical protein